MMVKLLDAVVTQPAWHCQFLLQRTRVTMNAEPCNAN